MFEGLRKKLSDAVKGFIKKEEPVIEQKEDEEAKPDVPKPERQPEQARKEAREEKKLVKVSLKTKLKSVVSSSVFLDDDEIDGFLENIRDPLLESDVSYETTEAFLESLRNNLKTTKVDSRDINKELVEQVRRALFGVLSRAGNGIDINAFVKERVSSGSTPVKILFLGPNGTGKTTTMAKIAYRFKKSGISSVLAASDTFRAAAIEQTEHHANKVGVPVIKSKYGADPASIAFDAIAYAKAHGIQTVLIDSAGRQETNKNLINEMQKMVRVAKPDLTIFVGESTAGNALSEQVREFNKFMKIDGIILTKIDCDVKGGNAISIAYTTGIPILFLGTGESYEALQPYTPEFIVDAILPNN
jgi:fused signal recognition particle receptor